MKTRPKFVVSSFISASPSLLLTNAPGKKGKKRKQKRKPLSRKARVQLIRKKGLKGTTGRKLDRTDPTRTLLLRKAFVTKLRRRFKLLQGMIWKLIVTDDVFGLNDRVHDISAVSSKLSKGVTSTADDDRFAIETLNEDYTIQQFNTVMNAWCPTGEGGGQDNSCGSSNKTDSPAFKEWFGNSKVVDQSGKPMVVYHGTRATFDEFKTPDAKAYPTLDQMLGAHFATDPEIANTFTRSKYSGYREGGQVKPVYLSIQNPRQAPQRTLDNGELEHDAFAINRDILNNTFPHNKELFTAWITKARLVTKEQGGEIFDRLSKGESIGNNEYNGVAGHDLSSKSNVGLHPVASYVADYDNGLNMLSHEQKTKVVDDYKSEMKKQGYDGIKYTDTAPDEIANTSNRTAYIAFQPEQIKSAIGNRGTYSRIDKNVNNAEYTENRWGIFGGGKSKADSGGSGDNCGIGPGGFQPGNTCGSKDGQSSSDSSSTSSKKDGEPQHSSKINTPEFKAWFKGSKVIDKEGNPKETEPTRLEDQDGMPTIVYHGTSQGAFDEFSDEKISKPDELYYGRGFYFTEDVGAAKIFAETQHGQAAKPTVMSMYLAIRKPFDVDKDEINPQHLPVGDRAQLRSQIVQKAFTEDGRSEAIEAGRDFDSGNKKFTYEQMTKQFGVNKDSVRKVLEGLGHDGMTVVSPEVSGKGKNRFWIAFKPQQIKRTDNKGTFDPTSPNMLNQYYEQSLWESIERIVGNIEWDEAAHPRDEKGRFGENGSSTSTTELPSFKQWFSGSKVVDKQGNPEVQFHSGTFSEEEDGILHIGEQGMHFGTKDAAEERVGGKYVDDFILDATIEEEDGKWFWSSQGVDSMDDEGFASEAEAREDLERTAVNMDNDLGTDETPITQVYLAIRNPKRVEDQKADWTSAVKRAKTEGYDGIVYKNQFESKGSTSWIAFYPHQVKSVNNRGTFSADDPHVLNTFNPDQPRDADGKFGSGDGSRDNEIKTNRILAFAKGLPKAMVDKVKGQVQAKYGKLSQRYGTGYAKAIIGAALIGLPVPLPGASFASASVVLGIAELHRLVSGGPSHTQNDYNPDVHEAMTEEEIEAAAKELVADLTHEFSDVKGNLEVGHTGGISKRIVWDGVSNANDFFSECARDEHGWCTTGDSQGSPIASKTDLNESETKQIEDFLYIKERKGLFWTDKPKGPYDELRTSDSFAGLIQRLPQYEGTVYRGTTATKAEIDSLKVGSEIKLDKNISTSAAGEIAASNYANQAYLPQDKKTKDGEQVVYVLEGAKGGDLHKIGYSNADTKEVVIPKGQTYRIAKVEKNVKLGGEYLGYPGGTRVTLTRSNITTNLSAADIDKAAASANPNPTEAQKRSGKYRMGHVTIQGLPISIETAKGSTRRGKNKAGEEWSVVLKSHYGYIKRTESDADGDHVDVFLGENPDSDKVFVIDQEVQNVDNPKSGWHFDEHKCMIGFDSADEAEEAYHDSYSDGWEGFTGMRELTMKQFKTWLKEGDTGKPIVGQKLVVNWNPDQERDENGRFAGDGSTANPPKVKVKKQFAETVHKVLKQFPPSLVQGVTISHKHGNIAKDSGGAFSDKMGGIHIDPDSFSSGIAYTTGDMNGERVVRLDYKQNYRHGEHFVEDVGLHNLSQVTAHEIGHFIQDRLPPEELDSLHNVFQKVKVLTPTVGRYTSYYAERTEQYQDMGLRPQRLNHRLTSEKISEAIRLKVQEPKLYKKWVGVEGRKAIDKLFRRAEKLTTNTSFQRPENYDKVATLADGRHLIAGANDWENGWTWAWIVDVNSRDDGQPLRWTEIDHAKCPACKGDPDSIYSDKKASKECRDWAKQQASEWAGVKIPTTNANDFFSECERNDKGWCEGGVIISETAYRGGPEHEGDVVTYHSPNKKLAESYVTMYNDRFGKGGGLHKSTVTISNPAPEHVIKSEASKLGIDNENYTPGSVFDSNLHGEEEVKQLVERLKKRGYDGAVLDDIAYGTEITDKAYITFTGSKSTRTPKQTTEGVRLSKELKHARAMAEKAGGSSAWHNVVARLEKKLGLTKNQLTTNAPERWRFKSDPEKVKAFQQWLKKQIGSFMAGRTEEQLWQMYAEAGFQRGAGRAFDDVDKPYAKWYAEDGSTDDFYSGTKEDFLRSSFGRPETAEKVKLLASRSFDDLKNVTEDMSTRMSRELTDGLVEGMNPRDIAREMTKVVDISRGRAEMIARTEIIRAHSEGQLMAFEQLGVTEVGVAVEFATADDEAVCPKCRGLEGVVLSIEEAHNVIPVHPNCRCAFLPANVGEESTKQIRDKETIDERFSDADIDFEVDEERPKALVKNEHVHNAFCPTGEGGGIDNSCSPSAGTRETSKGEILHEVTRGKDKIWRDGYGNPAPEHVQKLGIPPAWTDVTVNADPNGDLMATGVDKKGRVQMRYSANHNAEAAAAKFGRVTELRAKRAQIYSELEEDAKNPELKEQAECLKLIMQTGIRPGGDADTGADYKSYGATTLKGSHVLQKTNGDVYLRFTPGKKKGEKVSFDIDDPATAKMLLERKEAAGSTGRLFNVSAGTLREYSRGKDGGDFKVKDHRTALGTETAIKAMGAMRVPANKKTYKSQVKRVAEAVAEKLGNTPSIALKSYIDPVVFSAWRKKAGV